MQAPTTIVIDFISVDLKSRKGRSDMPPTEHSEELKKLGKEVLIAIL